MNIESARSKTKSFTRPFVVIDQHPENQHDFSRKKALPGERLYEDAPNETESKDNSKQSNKLIIFVDSIPPEIKVSGINYYLKFSEIQMHPRSFCSWNEILWRAHTRNKLFQSSTSTCRHQRYSEKYTEARY